MKFGPATKSNQRTMKKTKKKKTKKKKKNDDVISAHCYIIVIFPIYGQFGAIWKPDSRRMVCKTYIFNNSNLLSNKN